MPSDIPTDQFEDDFSAVSARNSTTFTHSGSRGGTPFSKSGIACIQAERMVRDEESGPGLLEEYDFAVNVLFSSFSTAPAKGDVFESLGGKSYRVFQIKHSPDGLVGEFQLNTIHK